VIESINQAIVAGLGLSVLSKSLIALLVAATLTIGLYRLKPEDRGDAFGDQRPFWIVIARLFGWVMIVGISISAIFGYPVLASFLADQLVTIVILTVLTYIGRQIAEDSFDYLMSPSTKAFRSIQSASGLSRPALEQIAVILSGVLQLLVLGLGVTLALAPWRVDSGDILLPLKAVIFGFTIGEVTISFGAAFFAILLFGAGILLTRGLQRWLTQNYLPRTHLDSGLRNSIVTGIGYAGFIVAAAVSLSGLGLSLEKVTIVAGALSVGIGFGLQSIVNNFVSGLILLWERAIRVGDWVAVGAEEGHVKRINVRATEIETFDRSVLIVPNSSLVSGVVKNRVHNDRTGRVVISVPVARDADPDLVHRLMSEAAQANSKLLRDPAPNVQYKKLGETVKEFELTGFVAEVDDAGRVSSDLLFAIDRALRAHGLGEILSRTVMVNEERSK
jgi:potassium efflux system protein